MFFLRKNLIINLKVENKIGLFFIIVLLYFSMETIFLYVKRPLRYFVKISFQWLIQHQYQNQLQQKGTDFHDKIHIAKLFKVVLIEMGYNY